jgi:site-specific DNA-methyltransferase (adenine-specific)
MGAGHNTPLITSLNAEHSAVPLILSTIHQGDCVSGMRQIPAGVIDLAFADPPFNIGYEYDVYHDRKDYESYLNWTRQWMREVVRVLQPNGTFWVAIGDEYAAEVKLIAQNELGLYCRSWIIWYYTFGVRCTKKFSRSHAHLLHFVKNRNQFTFNDQYIRVPSARQSVYADSRANPDGKLPDDTWILRPQDLPEGFKEDQDTWYFPRVAGTFQERAGFHGCQMPEQLLGRIIRSCSNPEAVVLDPFAGSGTTLVVAKKLGREWIGFELSEKYAQQATSRIANAQIGQVLEGAPEPLISAPKTPNKAILDAYRAAHHGFSTDRVIADPELNQVYIDYCRRLGIIGQPVDWNRALLGLRKSGKVVGLPATRRTTFSRTELDRYIFASEIAMRRLFDEKGLSFDDVLCDPGHAKLFDDIARSFAPGFSSLQYRWAGLTLRKEARDRRNGSRQLTPNLLQRRFTPPRPVENTVIEKMYKRPGIYLVCDDRTKHFYAGETCDLGIRCHYQFEEPAACQTWAAVCSDIRIQFLHLPDTSDKKRRALQSHFIAKFKPLLNHLDLGVA